MTSATPIFDELAQLRTDVDVSFELHEREFTCQLKRPTVCAGDCAWIGVCLHCNGTWRSCQPCKTAFDADVLRDRSGVLQCARCGVSGRTLAELFVWIPIGSTS